MFSAIDSQEALDRFLDEVDHFHDALLREVALKARGYVDAELRMFGDVEPYDARLIVQMQSADTPCIEMVFEDVTEVSLQPSVPLAPSGEYNEEGILLTLARSRTGPIVGVRARRAKYRILGRSFLGKKLLTIEEIPVGDSHELRDTGSDAT